MPIRRNTESARAGQRERGAAVVEMAFVAPLLIILLLGIFTVARAYNVKNTMDHAVREGARFGATIDPWDAGDAFDDIEALVLGELGAAAIPAGLVTVNCADLVEAGNDGCDVGGNQVTNAPADLVAVHISVEDYELNFVFWTFEVDFSSQAVARYES
jgi:Flp pilus assembly protein TadG